MMNLFRGRGTGEAGEASASPDFRGWLKYCFEISGLCTLFHLSCLTWNCTVPTSLIISKCHILFEWIQKSFFSSKQCSFSTFIVKRMNVGIRKTMNSWFPRINDLLKGQMGFTSCILFTSETSEQNTTSKGHLALKKGHLFKWISYS